MGSCLSQEAEVDFEGPVDFNHFQILRAIGKGAFGKVCIVKKKDTKQMYALKYMNKIQMIHKHALDNVFREIKILRNLEHEFLVNLWFTFHDREDIFMVLDLMLGGDISYHLEKAGRFNVPRVKLYLAELSLALDYLRSRRIIHRDIKPANMLLDSQGHAHLTDFNVATVVRSGYPITSTTGTKPYMAPEVIQSSSRGYSYPVDWWGLGVSAYEMLRGSRPFTIDKHISGSAMHTLLTKTRPSASASWDKDTCDILKMLLHPDEDKRLQCADKMRTHPFFQSLDWDEVERKEAKPPFVPPQNRINCDPTHELEEMIVEPNPLHKKQHRLSKRSHRNEDEEVERELTKMDERFKIYDRRREKEKAAAKAAAKDAASKSREVSVESQGRLEEVSSVSPGKEVEAEGQEGAGKGSGGRNSREVVGDKHLTVSAAAWSEAVDGEVPGGSVVLEEGVAGEANGKTIAVMEVTVDIAGEGSGSPSRVEERNSEDSGKHPSQGVVSTGEGVVSTREGVDSTKEGVANKAEEGESSVEISEKIDSEDANDKANSTMKDVATKEDVVGNPGLEEVTEEAESPGQRLSAEESQSDGGKLVEPVQLQVEDNGALDRPGEGGVEVGSEDATVEQTGNAASELAGLAPGEAV